MPTTAVLSLNGAPQLTLSAQGDGVNAASAEDTSPSVAGVATQRVMQLLGSVLRIRISDRRVVVGTFHCFDKHQNIILTDTREYLPLQRPGGSINTTNGKKGGKQHKQQPPPSMDDEREDEEKERWKTETSRNLGMALVPGKHIVYIKVENKTSAKVEEEE